MSKNKEKKEINYLKKPPNKISIINDIVNVINQIKISNEVKFELENMIFNFKRPSFIFSKTFDNTHYFKILFDVIYMFRIFSVDEQQFQDLIEQRRIKREEVDIIDTVILNITIATPATLEDFYIPGTYLPRIYYALLLGDQIGLMKKTFENIEKHVYHHKQITANDFQHFENKKQIQLY